MNNLAKSACRHLLRPVISVLLRAGFTWKEFSMVSREMYVDVATREYGIEGRPTNISRVAILTGLSRKQVREHRRQLEDRTADDSGSFYMNPATRVITGWHEDPDFSTEGRPNELAPRGERSFADLLARYGGDIPPVALEKELRRTGVIEEADNGMLRATKRVFMPEGLDEQYLRLFGAHIHDLASTMSYNARADQPRFQRAASAEKVPVAIAAKFHQIVRKQGQELLQRLDAWLAQHEATTNEAVTRIGVGIYFFQDEDAAA
ncbi:MAG: hypothetical protein HKN49_10725 [Gammaproteobacteria bacterium]|nr:hypothetical protein [Gammaproteobacteria bacterium]